MRKYFFNLAMTVVCCLSAFSCAKETLNSENKKALKEVTINVDATKLTLEAGDLVYWSAGDQISVFNGTDVNDTQNAAGGYQFTANESGASVSFTGSIPEEITDMTGWVAYYKYNSGNKYDGTTLTVNAPNEFGDNTKIYPRLAGVMTGNNVVMKQVGALLAVTLSTDNITSIRLRGNNEEHLAGWPTITFDGSGNPVWANDAADTEYAQYGSILFSNDEGFAAGTYYFPVPPVEFTDGITLTFTKKDAPADYAELVGTNPLTVSRATIKSLGTVDSNLKWFKGIQFSCIDFPTKGAKSPVWPFVEAAAKSTSTTDVKTFTTKAEGAEFKAVVQGFCANTTSAGQGVKMGNKVGDYLEFPTFSGYGLSKVVVVSGKNGNDTKKCEYCLKNGSDIIGTNWINSARGAKHTWEISSPQESAYRFEIVNEGDNLTLQRFYLYYATLNTEDPSVLSITTNSVAGAAADEYVNCTGNFGHVTLSGSFTARGFSADQFTCGFEYRLYGEDAWTSIDASSVNAEFNANLSGLSAKRYEFRAWAKSAFDETKKYGEIRTFMLSDGNGIIYLKFSFAPTTADDAGIRPAYYDYVGTEEGKYIPKANDYKFEYNGTETELILPSDEGYLVAFKVNGISGKNYGPAYRYATSKYMGFTLNACSESVDLAAYLKMPVISGMYLSRLGHIHSNTCSGYSITSTVDPTTCKDNATESYRTGATTTYKLYYTPAEGEFPQSGDVYYCVVKRLTPLCYLELRYKFKSE